MMNHFFFYTSLDANFYNALLLITLKDYCTNDKIKIAFLLMMM